MDKLKAIREARNEAVNKLEEIHNEYEGKELPADVKAQWNDAKKDFEKNETILNRESFLEDMKAQKADRNTEDGEAKELRNQFSYKEAIAYAVNPNLVAKEKRGFYNELNQEAQTEAQSSGVTLQGGGVVIPNKVMNAVTSSSDFTETSLQSNFIEKLNERTQMIQLGADMLDGLTGNLKWSKEGTQPAFVWEGENDLNQESDPTFSSVVLSPKRGGTFVEVSNQALRQTSPSIDQRIERQLVGAVSRGLESTAVIQSNANAPTGIMDLDRDISGADGDALTRDTFVDLETEVAVGNADLGNLAYYTNAQVRGAGKKTPIASGSDFFVIGNDGQANGYPVAVSNLMPADLVKGAGDPLSGLIFGNFEDVIFGMWGGIEILSDPYTKATNGMTRLVLNVYSDVKIVRDESFAFAHVDLA